MLALFPKIFSYRSMMRRAAVLRKHADGSASNAADARYC
jgi:hypothetical protein